MQDLKQLRRNLAAIGLAAALAGAQTPGKRDAGGYPAPTAELERGRTVYVLSSCHLCHGSDLTGAAMGAANLMSSPLVGRDQKGNLIGAVVRAGLPNLQTAMPQYPDYTNQQIADLAAYIHYLRQQGRYRELAGSKDATPGNPKLGQQYFTGGGGCGGCHSPAGDLAGVAQRYDGAALRIRMLRPGSSIITASASPGEAAHLQVLERYSNEDVRNLLAYLSTLTAPR